MIQQLKVVLGILERFCASSSQKVNTQKSKNYVSTNMSKDRVDQLERVGGLVVTRNLGTYLGMLVLH